MRRSLFAIAVLLMGFVQGAWAQSQKVKSGNSTQAVNFAGCVYNWVNDTPGIGLAASGTGDINAFKAINNGNAPIVATIKATSIPVQYAYIPGSTGITVINTSTNAVVTTIPVAYSSANVAATPDGARIYISDPLSNSVYVINTSTNTVMATIPVGVLPSGITVTPDGKTVFVGNYDDNTISVISTATNKVITVLNGFDRPFELKTAPVGNLLYVLSQATGNTWVVNTTNNTIVSILPSISEPWDIAISPDGTRLYIVGESDNSVHVFNATTYAAIATIPVGLTPENITISPDGSSVYVGCFNAAYVAVISTATNTVTRKLTMGAPQGVAVSADGKTLYAVNNYFGTLNAIDLTTGNIIATISTGFGATAAGNFLASVSCPPVSFTITVNPANATPPTITAGPVTGTISACAGTASVSPQIQQFTVSGSNLADNITATAPANFEVSLSPGSGYGPNVMVTQTGGTVAGTTIYVRSSATADTGNINGSVVLTSTTTTQNVAVNGVVDALPTVNSVGNQTVTNGGPTTAVNFTGTSTTYDWVNDTPGIGLPANGTGNIASFNAVNTGTTPVTATITATPVATKFAYIGEAGEMSVINLTTNKQITTVITGQQTWAVTVSPDGTKVYVSNSKQVSVFSTANNMLLYNIPIGYFPQSMCLNSDGSLLYVLTDAATSNVKVINTTTLAVLANVGLPEGYVSLTISPDNSKVYAVDQRHNDVTVINTSTNLVATNIAVGVNPIGIVVSPDGSQIFVVNESSFTVSVISAATNTVVQTIKVQKYPIEDAITPDGRFLYVTNSFSGTVSVIDTQTDAVISTIKVGNGPFGISVSPDGDRVVAVNQGSNNVSVISTGTNEIVATIPVGTAPDSPGNFISSGLGCSGAPITFTITVNPSPAPTITPGPVTGTITACAGTASQSPQIQQFIVSGSNLAGNITATAPINFEVSLSPGSGYGPNVMIVQTGGTAASNTIYVRSSATAATGNINGNVVLTSKTATQNVPVNGVVNALPTVNSVGNQTVTNGEPTTAVNFAGTGNTFTWTNDTPGIGLTASGTGDIASFTAINSGTIPVKATVAVTTLIGSQAFVPCTDNTVRVINNITNTVVAIIPVEQGPIGVSVSHDGTHAYVTDAISATVSVISAVTDNLITTIPVDVAPIGVVVSPDDLSVYVASSNSVSVINATMNTVKSKIPLPAGSQPRGICISPDGGRLYLADEPSKRIFVINTSTDLIITTISLTLEPHDMIISPDGSKLYVTDFYNAAITVVNITTDMEGPSITVGFGPQCLTLAPGGNLLYVANSGSNTISVINTTSNTVLKIIHVDNGPYGVSMNADGSILYVTEQNSYVLSAINPVTGTFISDTPVSQNPLGIGNFVTNQGCTGPATNFTITVNPTPASPPTITASPVTGTISACAGTASVFPNVQETQVSGTDLTGAISLTAPNGFEISLSGSTGFSNSLTLTPVGGTVNSTAVYVRIAATAPAGSNFANIEGTSPGAKTIEISVTGTVNALPTVNPVGPQTFNNGQATTAINFTGTGNTFTWTNDTPGIGLAASGTGDIASFTAVNTGPSTLVANISAIPANAGYAYIANYGARTVSVINIVTNKVVSTIKVGVEPSGVSVSPDDSKVYVANQSSNNISVVSILTNSLIATINVGLTPTCLSVSPDGTQLYAANQTSNTVTIINAITNTVTATVTVGTEPTGIATSRDGSLIYVANQGSNNVTVLSALTDKIVATIPAGNRPAYLALSPDGSKLYVTGYSVKGAVTVISTVTNSRLATIAVNSFSTGLAVSPDGSKIYVANQGSNNLSVINATTNTVIATIPVGRLPIGVSVTSDGGSLYVTNEEDNDVYIINTTTDLVVDKIDVGELPATVGNFISSGTSCTGPPIKFTITVNPTALTSPAITASAVTGIISACEGTASTSPNIQQFTVSGNNLTNDITAVAPSGFEISLLPTTGYTGAITLTQTGGTVNNTVIYVRSAASAYAGTLTNSVQLATAGAANQAVVVSAVVNALPTVNPVSSPTFINAISTTPIVFTGTANAYSWTNSNPSIGLPANGTGDIPSFSPVNTGTGIITANILVTGHNTSGCPGTPAAFTITVTPTPIASINTTGTLSPLTTIYGTPSASESFSVSGNALTGGILATPPTGFELSTDNANFNPTVLVGTGGTFPSTPVYIRLAAISPVNSYSGNIALTNAGAATVNIAMPLSTVTPAPLTITADNQTKVFDTPNPFLTASYTGFVNNENPTFLTSQPVLSTTALLASLPGQYPITVSGAKSTNYTITTFAGVLTILPNQIVIPNTFTPNGDGVNDTWNIGFLNTYANCTVDIYTRWGQKVYSSIGYGTPWDGNYKSSALPVGTYYYIIDLKNSTKPLSGFVALIR